MCNVRERSCVHEGRCAFKRLHQVRFDGVLHQYGQRAGYTQVFWTILRTKIALGLIFGAAFFAILYANLLIVRMLTPRYRPLTPDQEVIERYRVAFEPYAWWLLPVIAGVIALFVGFGVTAQWRTFLLWRNGSDLAFGTPEPLFGRDPAFYVFGLPWLEFVQGWLFSSLVGVTFITALAHYLWGGIRPQAPGFGEKVTPQVKAHLSVLLGLIILIKAWGYHLGTFDLLTSKRGVVEGASYTDVRAQLPALRILTFIAVACAAGTTPPIYAALDPELRDTLTVGRPIASS